MYFGAKEKNAVTLPHSAQMKHVFWGGNEANVKTKENSTLKESCFGILHHRLRHISTRSLMAGDTANV